MVINNKIIKIILFMSLFFLNGCMGSVAVLGPIFSVGASGGNAYQTSISLGSSSAIKEMTGKTPSEHLSKILDNNKESTKKQN
jgi:hypothetical protein